MIHAQLEAFEDRNQFLQSLLGALSFAERFSTLLTACGPSRRTDEQNDAGDDAFLDAMLGLLSLALSLQAGALDAIGDGLDATASSEMRPPTEALTPRQLLA